MIDLERVMVVNRAFGHGPAGYAAGYGATALASCPTACGVAADGAVCGDDIFFEGGPSIY